MINPALPAAAFEALTLISAWAWWCMAREPKRWAQWVDRENDFWRDKRLISPALAERLKRWEKSRALKRLAAATTCAGAIGVVLTLSVMFKAASLENRRPGMLYNPALHGQSIPTRPKP
jgi:hypothetical protein